MPQARPVFLSIFPGIDLLGKAFEQEFPEACLVRGPDPLYGGDIRGWHVPAGVFSLIFGGPPCQAFSILRFLNPACGAKHGNLIPEFERVVGEAQPEAFLMENVPTAPPPDVPGYVVRSLVLNNRWVPGDDGVTGAEQNRQRRFSFGTRDGRALDVSPDLAIFEAPLREYAVTSSSAPGPVRLVRDGQGGHRLKTALRRAPTVIAGHSPVSAPANEQRTLIARVPSADGAGHSNFPDEPRYSLAEMCRLQGLPETFADELPFTMHGKRRAIGNAVPMPLGRAVARGVRRAMGYPLLQEHPA